MGVFLIFAILTVVLFPLFICICVADSDKAYDYTTVQVTEIGWNGEEYIRDKTETKLKSKFWLWAYETQGDVIHFVFGALSIIFLSVTIGLSIAVGCIYVSKQLGYNKMQQQYIILTERLGKDNSNYHLFYEDITAYNNAILEDKYWADNLWVNWYHNGLIKDLPLIGEEAK